MNAVRLLALLFVTALLGAGCKGPCQALAEKICQCTAANNFQRDECYRAASSEADRVQPSADEESVCQQRLETCECDALDTPEGKQACGLAR